MRRRKRFGRSDAGSLDLVELRKAILAALRVHGFSEADLEALKALWSRGARCS